ncbi:MAG: flavodoxin family protein [Clostridia bacterium]|nr:flavodoxin family protein [Clostridia bacterium]
MARKTLIINGSPRPQGNTAALIAQLKSRLEGEVIELSAFRSDIAPCVDCRSCWTTAKCAVRDEMQVIYNDDFDNVVLASPVYYSTLPGQVLSLMSRLQPWHAAKFFLNKPLELREKRAAVILTAGGKGNQGQAFHHVRALFRMLNASGYEEHWICSPNTDTVPAEQDEQAMEGVHALADWLNGDNA